MIQLNRRMFAGLLPATVCGLVLPHRAWAQTESSAPAGAALTIVVPNPPGGTVDALARLVARLLYESAGQNTLVRNQSGGNHVVAANELLNSMRPDDVLFLGSTNLLSYVPMLSPQTLNFTPETELLPVAVVGSVQYPLVARKELDVASLLARGNGRSTGTPPTVLLGSVGSAGTTSFHAMNLAQFLQLNLNIVPYHGMADVQLALQSGQVEMALVDELAAHRLQAGGKVRLVATMSDKPCILLPAVPMWHQRGHGWAPYQMDRPLVLMSGRRMSSARREQLGGMLKAVERLPAFLSGTRELGVQPLLITGDAARAHVREVVAQERQLIERFRR